jgi:hypothetical protein
MKKQLNLPLGFLAGLLTLFSACKKDDGLGTFIRSTYTSAVKTKFGSTQTGTFEATGGISGQGKAIMDVHVTDDSTFCTVWFTQDAGSVTLNEACSRDMADPTGSWRIVDGTGIYSFRHGSGKLTMAFPPNVPQGVTVIETYRGIVWVRP